MITTNKIPCGTCKNAPWLAQNPSWICQWCISDEDIALAVMNPAHPVDFTHYEPMEGEKRE